MTANKSKIRISLVQFPIETNLSFEKFLAKHEAWYDKALQEKADLLIFPELLGLDLVDFSKALPPQWERIGTELAPKYFASLKEKAKQTGMWILGGSLPVKKNEGIYNTAPLFTPDGKELYQDKIFVTPEERQEWHWKNGRDIHFFDMFGAKTCILICHDSEFPAVSQKIYEQKPEVILVPSMTHDQFGLHRVRWCSQARSIEHQCYTVVTGTVTDSKESREYMGQAAFCTPQNSYFKPETLMGPHNEAALVTYELDMELLRKSRKDPEMVYPGRDQGLRSLDEIRVSYSADFKGK